MGTLELILIAVGLSMDAFAVAVCKGLNMRKLDLKHGFIISLFFGVFQGLMPLIGWFLGSRFASYIENLDHWIAFVLLIFIGGKMLYEAIKGEGECNCKTFILDVKELFILAVATSIDALAVGISFAFFDINIYTSVLTIAIITLCLSFLGVIIGNKFGSRYEKKAEIAGGIILIFIGFKILIEHLFFS